MSQEQDADKPSVLLVSGYLIISFGETESEIVIDLETDERQEVLLISEWPN